MRKAAAEAVTPMDATMAANIAAYKRDPKHRCVLREMEAAAYSLLPYTSRAMIEYGSEDDETVRNNAGAWSKYALVP